MEDIKIEMKKDIDNMNDAPPLNHKKIYYYCSECPSAIEIINMDAEFIEFKCNNEHNIKMSIEKYLNKIKNYKDQSLLNNTINNSRCKKHEGEEYLSYCFECNMHLCEKCLMTCEHSYHYKIYLLEIKPNDKIVKEIKNLIKNNKNKIRDLKKNKTYIETKINDILTENKDKIKDIKKKNKKMNYNNETIELLLNNIIYKIEIEELKKEYNNKLKNIKMIYNNNINKIKNKFKLINNKNKNLYNNKINILKKVLNIKKDNYKFVEKINKITNFNELIETVYNTYNNYNNNYYNSININNIYTKYFKNDIIIKTNHIRIKNFEIEKENII